MTKKKKSSKKNSVSIGSIIFIIFLLCYYFSANSSDFNKVDTDFSGQEVINASYSHISSDLEIYFFDVGQADSILISNSGEHMLIDAGNNQDGKLISEQLISMGITELNYLVGTHPHEDHIGGLDDIIDDIDIDNIYMPKRQSNTKTFEDILDSVAKKKMKITTPKVGDTFNIGEATCEIISVKSDAEDINDTSIVIELTFGNTKYLFTGDIGGEIEEEYEWDDIDVLKVAHHGSRYSSTNAFLVATKPEIAIISTGEGNDYGHPHKEALERLEKMKANIYRTDESGTIYIKSDGSKINVEKLNICLDGNN